MNLLPADFSPWLAAALTALSFVSSMLTASAGLGGGVIMLAVMATVMPPSAVIPTHGVIQLGSNAGRAFIMRDAVDRKVVGWFALGAVVGAAFGGSVMVALRPGVLELILGLFILFSAWGPQFRKLRIADRGFALVGVATTFLTMFVGGTGPFVAAFVNPDRFGKEATVATHGACMTIQHGFKVAVFIALGFAFGPWLALLAMMIAAGFLGTLTGRAVLLELPERTFKGVFRAVLTLLALRLLWSAATALASA
ncbi:MAG: sulfite exporter TauE/SafE family protein [Gammaproteobacteria bacterium]